MNDQQLRNLFEAMGRSDAADKAGAPKIEALSDVDVWADAHGGDAAVRKALAEGLFSMRGRAGEQLVRAWIAERDRRDDVMHAFMTLQADQRAAQAAERSARWAMWSALISLASAIVSAAAYWLTRVPT